MLNYLKREYFFSFSFEIYFGPVQNQEKLVLFGQRFLTQSWQSSALKRVLPCFIFSFKVWYAQNLKTEIF